MCCNQLTKLLIGGQAALAVAASDAGMHLVMLEQPVAAASLQRKGGCVTQELAHQALRCSSLIPVLQIHLVWVRVVTKGEEKMAATRKQDIPNDAGKGEMQGGRQHDLLSWC